MNSVERVRAICKERKIPVSRLERDLGFSNGYIGQLRRGEFPAERLMLIAEYLGLDYEYLLTGEQKEKPTGQDADGLKSEIYDLYESLPQAEQREAIAFLKGLLASHKRGEDRKG